MRSAGIVIVQVVHFIISVRIISVPLYEYPGFKSSSPGLDTLLLYSIYYSVNYTPFKKYKFERILNVSEIFYRKISNNYVNITVPIKTIAIKNLLYVNRNKQWKCFLKIVIKCLQDWQVNAIYQNYYIIYSLAVLFLQS